jgi:hypothetical protein
VFTGRVPVHLHPPPERAPPRPRGGSRAPVNHGGSIRFHGKPLSDASLRTGLLTLRLILERAVRTKRIPANPMHEVEWRGLPRMENVDPFTGAELRAMLAAAHERDADLAATCKGRAAGGPPRSCFVCTLGGCPTHRRTEPRANHPQCSRNQWPPAQLPSRPRTRANYLIPQNPCASTPSGTLNLLRLMFPCKPCDSCGSHDCRTRQGAASPAPQVHPARGPPIARRACDAANLRPQQSPAFAGQTGGQDHDDECHAAPQHRRP